MVPFVTPLEGCDPHDIAENVQELDHGRVSFDAIRLPLALAFKRV
jgi:hypothetical protein